MSSSQVRASLQERIDTLIESGHSKWDRTVESPNHVGRFADRVGDETESTTEKNGSDSREQESDPFSKIVGLVSHRDRSVFEIRRRLAEAGYDEAHANGAIERAIECGVLDDLRFADLLVRGRVSRGKGKSGIERELRGHGIDPECLPGWPDEYFESTPSEFDRALDLLRRKPPRSKNLRESAYGKLIRNGFSSSVSAEAASAFVRSFNAES